MSGRGLLNDFTPAEGISRRFSGSLTVSDVDALDAAEAVEMLEAVASLTAWAQALQARVVHRMEELINREVEEMLQKPDPVMAMSLTAAEAGSVLRLPHMTAMHLVSDSEALCDRYPETLASLSHGSISYRHAQAVIDQADSVPEEERRGFQSELLALAEGQTCAQLMRAARRLRERRWPETMIERHRAALEKRRVGFDPLPDGMGQFTAFVAAETGQAILSKLTAAARGQQQAGDTRTVDQLRADIFSSLMLGAGPDDPAVPQVAGNGDTVHDVPGIAAEIMVLIPADTLFGGDDKVAELNGYGPISSEAARRLARQALHWTGLVQDPATGEILAVGRRRRVPAGLKRWLQARDGTCRFPGCSVSTPRTEIDHTIPWSHGGPTEHGNLANLCPKHHRYKTLGFWSADQPVPGVLKWRSTLGRTYQVKPVLDYGRPTYPAAGEGPETRAG
ncbi:HNH endonuclease signature motif containing protein [Arthrobacter caoxuetaonis]|uniref:HNH endonuclease signature motif containing protein n=1 Tax=Arthrobacter caoxuetaonis TaxID=2886935 RepID=UPI001D14E55D|nr:HNH endonuclease signature motif containing protein [Arthrobacter caoxuetaonis]MCC3281553.1 HNH endonuclease [Arthrobacter caoxuetaonis]